MEDYSHIVRSESGSSGTQAIDRAALMLILVAKEVEPLKVTEIAARMGLSLSTASRIANALLRHQLLARDDRSRLHPGFALVHLAKRGGLNGWLISAADPSLDRIAQHTGETVTLAVPDGGQVQHLAQRQSRYAIGATDWVGQVVAPHCSSTGKVFIAFDALPVPERLDRLAEHTITDPDEFRRELEKVRERGVAVTRDELEEGLVAIAAPVTDPDGRTVGALSVSGPSMRLTPPRVEELKELVRAEAGVLSERFQAPARRTAYDVESSEDRQ